MTAPSITGVPHLCQTLYHFGSPQFACCTGLLEEVLFKHGEDADVRDKASARVGRQSVVEGILCTKHFKKPYFLSLSAALGVHRA